MQELFRLVSVQSLDTHSDYLISDSEDFSKIAVIANINAPV
jgi:hypothetical protein